MLLQRNLAVYLTLLLWMCTLLSGCGKSDAENIQLVVQQYKPVFQQANQKKQSGESAAQIFSMVAKSFRSIDTSQCPQRFQLAHLRVCQAADAFSREVDKTPQSVLGALKILLDLFYARWSK